MKLAALAVALVAGLMIVTAAHADGEGNGDPFPFHAPGTTVVPRESNVTRSDAYPDFDGSSSRTVVARTPDVMSMAGSEGIVLSTNTPLQFSAALTRLGSKPR